MKFKNILLTMIVVFLELIMTMFSVEAVSQTDIRIRDSLIGGERSQMFNDNWKFYKGTASGPETGPEAVEYNDSQWEMVTLPHDWLIEQTNNLYESAYVWYRKEFYLPEEDMDKSVSIRFDGIYMNSTVYINGQEVGNRPNGYVSFQYDITKYINYGNKPNVVAVKINHQSPNTRWYSGSGIYRNVWLTITDKVHVDFNGTYISTDDNNVTMSTEVRNDYDETVSVSIENIVLDKDGHEVSKQTSESISISAGEVVTDDQILTVNSPVLWSVDNPYIYKMKTEIKVNNKITDTYFTNFGFRTLTFTTDEGFYLNGEYMKLKGVCMHHDLGALGSAVNYTALERQLQIMKNMGANAIRVTHNPSTPELMEICDRIGLLVIEEYSDVWRIAKKKMDYSRFFDDWYAEDIASMVRRDRNHPCIIMWSIGNEVSDIQKNTGPSTAQMLKNEVNKSDYRGNAIVTHGSNTMSNSNSRRSSSLLDAMGYNYAEARYSNDHKENPNWIIYGSETSSAVRSRGIYHFPINTNVLTYFDNQCSSLGNSVVSWGKTAENSWIMDRDRKYILGQFVWTGFDYIGEPTPYSTKNSYFGMVDTAGLPKDIYYFYKSIWSDEIVLHLLPYWNWQDGEEIPVVAYTNADSVELFKDGESLGVQSVDLAKGSILHAEWKVPYSDGVITAKAYDKNGTVIAEKKMETFGESDTIKLTADKTQLTADGKELVFVEASIVDKNGVFVANAKNNVEFKVSGAGKLVGVDNGDSTDYDSYQATVRRAFSGKLVAIIESDGTEGEIIISADSPGLESDEIVVNAKHINKVTKIELNTIDRINEIITDNGSIKIAANVYPKDADYDKIIYSVDSPIASINEDGVLTAIDNGEVKVTAKAADGSGVESEIIIDIKNQSEKINVNDIEIIGDNVIKEKTGSIQLDANVMPVDATNKSIIWTVANKDGSDINYAKINNSGKVTALYDGIITVTAAAADGSKIFATKDITITNQCPEFIPINSIKLNVEGGNTVLTGDDASAVIIPSVSPSNTDISKIKWQIRTADGLKESSAATIEIKNGMAYINPKYNGEFSVMAYAENGTKYPQTYAMKKFNISGMTEKMLDPYKKIYARDYIDGSDEFSLEGSDLSNFSIGGLKKGSWCTFRNVDFGEFGCKTFSLTGGRAGKGSASISIHEGTKDGVLLGKIEFASVDESDWYVLGTQTVDLKLTGVHDLCFVFENGGFLFNSFFAENSEYINKNPYSEIKAVDYDEGNGEFSKGMYENHEVITGIGNNETLTFYNLDFGEKGSTKIQLRGKVDSVDPTDVKTVRIQYADANNTDPIEDLAFITNDGSFNTQEFNITSITGVHNISLVFMPGPTFNLDSFEFIEISEHKENYVAEVIKGDINEDIEISLMNNTDNAVKANLYIAAYDNNDRLIKVKSMSKIIDTVSSAILKISDIYDETAASYKAFIWDDTQKPLTSIITLPCENFDMPLGTILAKQSGTDTWNFSGETELQADGSIKFTQSKSGAVTSEKIFTDEAITSAEKIDISFQYKANGGQKITFGLADSEENIIFAIRRRIKTPNGMNFGVNNGIITKPEWSAEADIANYGDYLNITLSIDFKNDLLSGNVINSEGQEVAKFENMEMTANNLAKIYIFDTYSNPTAYLKDFVVSVSE